MGVLSGVPLEASSICWCWEVVRKGIQLKKNKGKGKSVRQGQCFHIEEKKRTIKIFQRLLCGCGKLCLTLCDPMDSLPITGFSRQEYWSGLPYPPPGSLLDPGIKPTSLMSPALAGGFFTTSTTWEAQSVLRVGLSIFLKSIDSPFSLLKFYSL